MIIIFQWKKDTVFRFLHVKPNITLILQNRPANNTLNVHNTITLTQKL